MELASLIDENIELCYNFLIRKTNFMNTFTNFFKTLVTISMVIPATAFAQTTVSQSTTQQALPAVLSATQQTTSSEPAKCTFATVGKPEFKGKFLAVKKKGMVQPGELFTVQVYVQNTGNVPWFSEESGCNSMTIVRLGTEKNRDRVSPFFTTEKNPETLKNSWIGGARIKMDNKRVSPLDAASFTITAKAPTEPGVYREFFAPVAEGVTWMEGDALFSVDISVGGATLDPNASEYLTYVQKSANLSKLKLEGGKNITVDLSEQRMYINIGETTIRTFPVSTGTRRTPTPIGKYSIFLKQNVRVAASKPHYIMPLYQMFKKGGYGIHALPSLANDKGVFWREALNHIGTPRSHGCIRLLPKDAEFVWNFTELGTPMTVRW